MSASLIRRTGLALLLACGAALPFAAHAQDSGSKPLTGQPGKDVMWLPSAQSLVDTMLDMAKVTPADFVVDLGSGDGRTVIAAAKRGARALGVEYDAGLVEFSRRNAEKEGVLERAEFTEGDLFETDFSEATVVTMFLLPEINLKLRPKILAMKPGTRVVSNSFDMGEWQPEERRKLSPGAGCTVFYCTAMLWIVPARVAGTYKVAQGEVALQQEFQMLTGTLSAGGKTVPLQGRVRGEDITFRAGDKEYHGRLHGKGLELRQK